MNIARYDGLVTFDPYPLQGGSTISRSMTALNHWVGGFFYATVTDTIDRIVWRTGSTASMVGTVTISVCAIDANGYPLGADISSTTRSSFAANTTYEETITAANVTRGTRYGVKVKVTAYTSGTLSVVSNAVPGSALGGLHPYNSYNISADTKNSSGTHIGVRYTTAGWIPTIGLVCPADNASTTSLTATGHCLGNVFTVKRRERMCGYLAYVDCDTAFELALYQGSTPTEVSGSVSQITATPLFVNANALYAQTPSSIVLYPGITYRAVMRALSATALSMNDLRFASANYLNTLPGLNPGDCKTSYNGTSWTDTTTDLMMINLALDGGPTDAPWPALLKGF